MMANTAYRNKHKLLGLCTECPKYAVLGYSKCEYHLQIYREHTATRYKKRKEEGKCPRCGLFLGEVDDGKIKCQNCREEI